MRYSILTPPLFEYFLSPLLMKNDFYVYLHQKYNLLMRDDEYPPLPLSGEMTLRWKIEDDAAYPEIYFNDLESNLAKHMHIVWGSLEMGMIPNEKKIPARILMYRAIQIDDKEPEYQMAYQDAREGIEVPAGILMVGNLTITGGYRDYQIYDWECVHVTTDFGGNIVNSLPLPHNDLD